MKMSRNKVTKLRGALARLETAVDRENLGLTDRLILVTTLTSKILANSAVDSTHLRMGIKEAQSTLKKYTEIMYQLTQQFP